MRTLSELEDSLAADLAWRRAEMQHLLAQVRSSSSVGKTALCRAGVAMLYAHWEGYTRHALSAYLRFVARRKLKLSELQDCFAAMALEAEIAKTERLSSIARDVRRVAIMRSSHDQRLWLPSKSGVDTQANLNSDVTVDLLIYVGLDPTPLDTKAHFIDYSLLRARNRIAHGEWESPSPEDYPDLHNEVLLLMSLIRNLVIDAAENTRYRKA